MDDVPSMEDDRVGVVEKFDIGNLQGGRSPLYPPNDPLWNIWLWQWYIQMILASYGVKDRGCTIQRGL